MRSKNREINIFNMSLLDILTGAVGAFMFMMLSFVPYYNIVQENKLTPKDREQEVKDLKSKLNDLEKKNDDLQKQVDDLIEKLKKASKGDASAEELAKLEEENNRLKKEIEELKDEIAKLKAENADLRDQIADLEDKVDQLQKKLDAALNENDQLRAEIEELKKKLATMNPGDPEARKKLEIAQGELFALSRSVFIGASIDGEDKFEFVVKDPKGFWYDTRSRFTFGEKSVRVTTFSGWDAQEFTEREERKNTNVSYVDIDSFLVPGTYLIGVRLAPAGGRFQTNKARPTLGQQLLKDFGSPTLPNASSSSSSGLGPTSLLGLPFGFATDAFAQSTNSDFRGASSQASAAPPKGYPAQAHRVFIRGIARVEHPPMRPSVSDMPTQTVAVDRWISLLARVTVEGMMFDFRWYNRLAENGTLTGTNIPGLGEEEDRRDLEEAINAENIQPLREQESCSGPQMVCDQIRDTRGDITMNDVDPMFRDKIILAPKSKQSSSSSGQAPASDPEEVKKKRMEELEKVNQQTK